MPFTERFGTSRPLAVWSALFVLYVIWGSTYLAIRFAVETLPPFLMASVRFLISGGILHLWCRARRDPAPTNRQWRSAAIVGIFLLVGGNGGVVWAEQRIASSVASLLVGALPLWMVLIDALRPGGRWPGWRATVGVAAGFAGVVVLVRPGASMGDGTTVDLAGAIAVLIGALFWSIGSLYSRTAPLPSSPVLATSMEMLAGGTGLLILGTLSGEWRGLDLAMASPRSLWGLLYLIVFGSVVAFTAYTWLLRVAPTPLVATYAYVNPLVAIVLGHFLAGESLAPRVVVAAMAIIGSVALITSSRSTVRLPDSSTTELVVVEESQAS